MLNHWALTSWPLLRQYVSTTTVWLRKHIFQASATQWQKTILLQMRVETFKKQLFFPLVLFRRFWQVARRLFSDASPPTPVTMWIIFYFFFQKWEKSLKFDLKMRKKKAKRKRKTVVLFVALKLYFCYANWYRFQKSFIFRARFDHLKIIEDRSNQLFRKRKKWVDTHKWTFILLWVNERRKKQEFPEHPVVAYVFGTI